MFTEHVQQSNNVRIAFCKIYHVLAKSRESFNSGEFSAESTFNDCEDSLISSIKELQLSRRTADRQVSNLFVL